MLPSIRFEASNRTIGELMHWATNDDGYFPINLNPPYQRGPVWSEEQSRNLIKSLLMDLPIGVVFVNHRAGHAYDQPPTMVDGQQRLRALMAFMDGSLTIPTDWVDDRASNDEYPMVPDDFTEPTIRYSDLTLRGQRSFRGRTVAVYETRLDSEAKEAELYLLINFGGVAQTDADLDRAATVAGVAGRDLAGSDLLS